VTIGTIRLSFLEGGNKNSKGEGFVYPNWRLLI